MLPVCRLIFTRIACPQPSVVAITISWERNCRVTRPWVALPYDPWVMDASPQAGPRVTEPRKRAWQIYNPFSGGYIILLERHARYADLHTFPSWRSHLWKRPGHLCLNRSAAAQHHNNALDIINLLTWCYVPRATIRGIRSLGHVIRMNAYAALAWKCSTMDRAIYMLFAAGWACTS